MELELVYHRLDATAVELTANQLSENTFYLCGTRHVLIKPKTWLAIPTGISLELPAQHEVKSELATD